MMWIGNVLLLQSHARVRKRAGVLATREGVVSGFLPVSLVALLRCSPRSRQGNSARGRSVVGHFHSWFPSTVTQPATQVCLSPVTPLVVARAFSSSSPTIWILSVIDARF